MVSAMLRFCLTLGAACLLMGCAGRTLEGRWHGQLPLVGASDCEIKLQKSGDFDFICAQPGDWAGKGVYVAEGDAMTLTFKMVINEGQLLKKTPSPIKLRVEGGGNELTLIDVSGMRLVWRRK